MLSMDALCKFTSNSAASLDTGTLSLCVSGPTAKPASNRNQSSGKELSFEPIILPALILVRSSIAAFQINTF